MLSRLLNHFFPYHARSTPELSRALRASAALADSPEERDEYLSAADALDRVLMLSQKHSDAPTRDAFSYALGRAELDLDDKLTEQNETAKETLLIVQNIQSEQAEHSERATSQRDEFQSFVSNLTIWRNELETWRPQVNAALTSLQARVAADQAMVERVDALDAQMTAMARHIKDIEDQLVAEGPRVVEG